MYARRVDGRTLTLAVSGLLWESSLVMIDQETQSLWSHLLGEAMQGPLQGKKLDVFPSSMTDWRAWRSRYPDSTVMLMSKTTNEYRRGVHLNELPLPTLPLPDALIIGLANDSAAKCWRFDDLRVELAINDRFGDVEVLVVFDSESGTASVFGRQVDGGMHTFRFEDNKLIDDQSQSVWDPVTGVADSGVHEGRQLSKLPGIVSLKPAWFTFHPDSTTWAPSN